MRFRIPNGSRRTDPERTPNGPRTDPERTPNEPRTDPVRPSNRSRTDPEQTPRGPRANPARTPNGLRTDPERTPNGPRCYEIFSEAPLRIATSWNSPPKTDTARTADGMKFSERIAISIYAFLLSRTRNLSKHWKQHRNGLHSADEIEPLCAAAQP